MRKKQIGIITAFTIIVTYFALYLQWAEFYKGYSYDVFNLFVSVIFLLAWLLFSFYWGRIQQKKYERFTIVYWGINIISAIGLWIFSYNKLVQSVLFPFYIWFGGPLYGFRYILFSLNRVSIDIPTLILITSPLGILFCFIGYWCGRRTSKLKEA